MRIVHRFEGLEGRGRDPFRFWPGKINKRTAAGNPTTLTNENAAPPHFGTRNQIFAVAEWRKV